jgi:hypothetical protein
MQMGKCKSMIILSSWIEKHNIKPNDKHLCDNCGRTGCHMNEDCICIECTGFFVKLQKPTIGWCGRLELTDGTRKSTTSVDKQG